jgi:hypothetical protein
MKVTDRPNRSSALCAAMVGLLVALTAPSPARAEALYGLVIGIDDYVGTVNDLGGAVNDATGIADALKAAGAENVTLLIDGAATKAAIEAGWFALVEGAVAGDTIVFSYAGHGDQEPEPPGRGGEEDGLNENFLLGGYQPRGPGTQERIVDDEINQWLKAADDKGIEVVFLADSCHSGTMFRSTGSKAIRYRTGTFEDPELADDLLELPAPASAEISEGDFKSVTFVAATQDGMLTPELMLDDGKPHGALSWYFAKAIEGAADSDGDGHLTQQELLAYLVPTVQAEAQNQQIPGVLPLRPDTKPIMRSMAGGTRAVDMEEPTAIRLYLRGDAGGEVPVVAGVEITEDESAADLIWDPAAGTVDHRIGGRVAEGVDIGGIAQVLSKWSALAFITEQTGENPVTLSTPSGNKTYKRGETVDIALDGVRFPYLTLFNLPPNGRVEYFYPASEEEVTTDWRERNFRQSFRVDRPPYGAEHLVAILTQEPAHALTQSLRSMSGSDLAEGLAAILMQTLRDTPFQAGVVGIYTSGGE